MGEVAINAEQADEAKAWIAQHPKRFLVLCFRRFIFFWAGLPREGLEQVKNLLFLVSSLLAIAGLVLAVKRRIHGVFLFATLVGSYPWIYYVTFYAPKSTPHRSGTGDTCDILDFVSLGRLGLRKADGRP